MGHWMARNIKKMKGFFLFVGEWEEGKKNF